MWQERRSRFTPNSPDKRAALLPRSLGNQEKTMLGDKPCKHSIRSWPDQGDDDRTRSNRVRHVVTFLCNQEGRRKDEPIVRRESAEAYTREELGELFRASSEEADMLLLA